MIMDRLQHVVKVEHTFKPHIFVVLVIDLGIHSDLNEVAERNLHLDALAETFDGICSSYARRFNALVVGAEQSV